MGGALAPLARSVDEVHVIVSGVPISAQVHPDPLADPNSSGDTMVSVTVIGAVAGVVIGAVTFEGPLLVTVSV